MLSRDMHGRDEICEEVCCRVLGRTLLCFEGNATGKLALCPSAACGAADAKLKTTSTLFLSQRSYAKDNVNIDNVNIVKDAS